MGSSYLFANNLRIHYLHWNLGRSDETVVLLHGLASNARIWELVAPLLAEQGFAVIAPDLRGHGLTDKPEGDYGFAALRQDLLEFLKNMHIDRPILAGHSWGGMITEDYAAHHPQGHLSPAGIVLVDGGIVQLNDEPGMTWERARDRLTPPKLGGTPQEQFVRRLSGMIQAWDSSGLALPIFLANFEVDSEERIWPRLSFERHMQIVRAIWEFQAYDLLQSIRCPALAVLAVPPDSASEGDLEFLARKRKGAQRAMGVYPKLQVEWMQDAIHDIPVQRPGDLARLMLHFIKQLN